ncbi:UNVERIFIED_CONTAM: hypothetical protein FKN15_036279 [Acipenser sinensis]
MSSNKSSYKKRQYGYLSRALPHSRPCKTFATTLVDLVIYSTGLQTLQLVTWNNTKMKEESRSGYSGGTRMYVRLIFGTLHPAYSSYKAVKSKDVKEYVKWMMYWIVFALFTTAETFTDIFLCWIPFYYELKIAFVVWLLSPYTKGSSVLYRKFVHPMLSSKEKEIDDYLSQAKDKSYDALVHFGRKGLNVAATAAVTAAAKGQGALSERLRSFSMQDLSTIQRDEAGPVLRPVPSKTPTAQPRSRTTARSKSETASGMLLVFEVVFIFSIILCRVCMRKTDAVITLCTGSVHIRADS